MCITHRFCSSAWLLLPRTLPRSSSGGIIVLTGGTMQSCLRARRALTVQGSGTTTGRKMASTLKLEAPQDLRARVTLLVVLGESSWRYVSPQSNIYLWFSDSVVLNNLLQPFPPLSASPSQKVARPSLLTWLTKMVTAHSPRSSPHHTHYPPTPSNRSVSRRVNEEDLAKVGCRLSCCPGLATTLPWLPQVPGFLHGYTMTVLSPQSYVSLKWSETRHVVRLIKAEQICGYICLLIQQNLNFKRQNYLWKTANRKQKTKQKDIKRDNKTKERQWTTPL